MVTFRNNNNRRNNFRRNDRGFKSNSDRQKFSSNFSNNDVFKRKAPGRNNDLAREASSNGDKILSENYFQHADHFTRILNEQESFKKAKYSAKLEDNNEFIDENKIDEDSKKDNNNNEVVNKKENSEVKIAVSK